MTLKQVKKVFPKEADCIKHLEAVLWNNQPRCPYCQHKNASPMPSEHRYHCNNCHTSFSVTVGTPFHRTRLDLRLWFLAIHYYLQSTEISLRQMADKVGVTKDTATLIRKRLSIAPKELLERIINFK